MPNNIHSYKFIYKDKEVLRLNKLDDVTRLMSVSVMAQTQQISFQN